MAPSVSVIVPTFQRPQSLSRTLDSLMEQSEPAAEYEIIVIDNGCRDETAAVVASYAGRGPEVRYIRELRLGAHHARHAGARAARGEILAFTDDDVICASDWIAAWRRLFRNPAVGCAGGRVRPGWECEPPEWITPYASLLAILDRGPAILELHWPEDVYSCNMAIRQVLLFRVGGFNPDIAGGTFVGDGETGLLLKIWGSGEKVFYCPSAVVTHAIPASRLTLDYMSSRFANQGRADSFTSWRRSHHRVLLLAKAPLLAVAHVGYRAVALACSPFLGKRYYRSTLYSAYCRARLAHDVKLLRDRAARESALRDDWIADSQPGQHSGG